MKRIKKYILPTFALLIFIMIMNSGGVLKRSFSNKDDVLLYIKAIKLDVENGKWKQAQADFNELKSAWGIVEKRVQFSVERSEMNMIDANLARIGGAISIHDKDFVIIEINEVLEHWEELER
jgi:hypothetical protein